MLPMKDRIDPLIEERAPWLFRDRPGTALARSVLNRALSYDKTVEIASSFRDAPTSVIMGEMGKLLAREVTVSGLQNIPRHGPAMIVANHPTGIADGIILWHLLAPIRPDLYFFANRDILRVMPQMEDAIAPVEWRQEKRSHGKTRETMAFTRDAVEKGRLGIIFPSGRLAKRQGLRLYERPWMASAAMLARKFELPVIPVNIRARNSVLFYLFDLIHPTARHHAVPRDAEQGAAALCGDGGRGDFARGPACHVGGRDRVAAQGDAEPWRCEGRSDGQPGAGDAAAARAVLINWV